LFASSPEFALFEGTSTDQFYKAFNLRNFLFQISILGTNSGHLAIGPGQKNLGASKIGKETT
jgi:hypothetical protein